MGSSSGFRERRTILVLAIVVVASSWQFARGASNPVPRRQKGPEIIDRVATGRRAVALTFDDGPVPGYTPRILHLLDEEGARSTFFVTGLNATRHPDLLARITAAGNEVGNHTWSHHNLTWMLERDQRSEIVRGAESLKALGVHPLWFRPPYGLISRLGVHDVTAIGERTALWSLSVDRAYSRWGSRAAGELLARVRPGDIILAHDKRPRLFGVLRALVEGLRARGYRCVTLTELVAGT